MVTTVLFTHAFTETPIACSTAATMMEPTDNQNGILALFVNSDAAYSANTPAASAIGAAKPATMEIQPAMNPKTGCPQRDRIAYSPPEIGSRFATAA